MGGDVFEDPSQHPLMRALARPQAPEQIAADLVELVRRPRPVMYANLGVRLGLWLSLSSAVRRTLGIRMAATVRRRLGLSLFAEQPQAAETAVPKVKRSTAASKRKSAGKKGKPAGTRARKSPSATARSKSSSRKSSEAKPRRRRADKATQDHQPG
jgi:hypothetical protein